MVARSVPAKRKKTVDMADSPPKRVTRARAAKAPEDAEPKPKTTKIATASAKAVASKRKGSATSTTKSTKRKTRADDQDGAESKAPTQEVEALEQPKVEPAKARVKQKRAIEVEDPPPAEALKPQVRQTKATAAQKPKPDTTKGRGRPKRAATTGTGLADAAPTTVEQPSDQVPAKKTTRGRAAPITARSGTAATSAKSTAPKKKVQFEEDQGKENIPITAAGPKKSAIMSTGMKAKPVRKQAATRTTARGNNKGTKPEEPNTEAVPLSPKKVNQVAKTPSASSEDEVSREQTSNRSPSKSPAKGLPGPAPVVDSISKPNSGRSTPPSSPSKQMSSSVLSGPARRPPLSPYKDGMKSSPRKINLDNNVVRPVFSTFPNQSPLKMSLLQESPRKAKLVNSTSNPIQSSLQSPVKSSLLQSPARRPMISPFKDAASDSPNTSFINNGNLKVSPKKGQLYSSSNVMSGPLSAAKSPEHLFKVHEITNVERNAQPAEVDALLSVSRSAKRDEVATPTLSESHIAPDSADHNASSIRQPQSGGDKSVGPSPINPRPPIALPAFASMDLRRTSVYSQLSEDELASPDKKYTPTPLRKHGSSVQEVNTPTMVNSGVSMTPLANQLSGWAASSPNKQRPSRQQRGLFSIGCLAMEQDEVEQMDVDAIVELPVQSSFFDDEMAVIDAQKQIATPEMAAREAENAGSIRESMESQASQEYGDENAMPTNAEMLRAEQEADDPTLTCTPARVFTPAKQVRKGAREICTVSKVPLRPSAEDSPLILPRQRSKSTDGALAVLGQRPADELKIDGNEHNRQDIKMQMREHPATPRLGATLMAQTPSSGLRLDAATPGRTARKNAVSNVLKGAVVHVDVHTTEGADASSIFVDLLTQMGARCVKQWNWNPRGTLGDSLDSIASPPSASPNGTTAASKVGITHVVYKDGGKRTLEKVRLSNGVVLCVGVGWVLE